MKFPFLVASVTGTTPLGRWLFNAQANNYITNGFYPCEGLDMPLIWVEDSSSIFVSFDYYDAGKIFATPQDPENLLQIRCGDAAFALEKIGLDEIFQDKSLYTLSDRFEQWVNVALELRRNNPEVWLSGIKLRPGFDRITTPASLADLSWVRYAPFPLPQEIRVNRLNALASSMAARSCRWLHVGERDMSIRLSGVEAPFDLILIKKDWEMKLLKVVLGNTCRHIIEALDDNGSEIFENLPKNVDEMRQALVDPNQPDELQTKAQNLLHNDDGDVRVEINNNILGIECKDVGYVRYSSTLLNYEYKPRTISHMRPDLSSWCAVILEKAELVKSTLSKLA